MSLDDQSATSSSDSDLGPAKDAWQTIVECSEISPWDLTTLDSRLKTAGKTREDVGANDDEIIRLAQRSWERALEIKDHHLIGKMHALLGYIGKTPRDIGVKEQDEKNLRQEVLLKTAGLFAGMAKDPDIDKRSFLFAIGQMHAYLRPTGNSPDQIGFTQEDLMTQLKKLGLENDPHMQEYIKR